MKIEDMKVGDTVFFNGSGSLEFTVVGFTVMKDIASNEYQEPHAVVRLKETRATVHNGKFQFAIVVVHPRILDVERRKPAIVGMDDATNEVRINGLSY